MSGSSASSVFTLTGKVINQARHPISNIQ